MWEEDTLPEGEQREELIKYKEILRKESYKNHFIDENFDNLIRKKILEIKLKNTNKKYKTELTRAENFINELNEIEEDSIFELFSKAIKIPLSIEYDVPKGELSYTGMCKKFPALEKGKEKEVLDIYYSSLYYHLQYNKKNTLLKLFDCQYYKYDILDTDKRDLNVRDRLGYEEVTGYNNFIKNHPDLISLVKMEMVKIVNNLYNSVMPYVKLKGVNNDSNFIININEDLGCFKIVYKLK
jgi:hypothetical protein